MLTLSKKNAEGRIATLLLSLSRRYGRRNLSPNAMRLPIWHTRHVPDLAGGPPLVHDLTRNVLTDFACTETWRGQATLRLHHSEHELLHRLAPREVCGGFRCAIAFTITGAQVRPA